MKDVFRPTPPRELQWKWNDGYEMVSFTEEVKI